LVKDSARPEFWDERFSTGITPWDLGGVPPDLKDWLATPRGKMRVLVPGCGSAYEARYMAELGHNVTAIDFSDAALAAALKVVGPYSDVLVKADFFGFQPAVFDLVYERAFLCALPRASWRDWGRRMSTLVRSGGVLAGFFYFDANRRGPPFGIAPELLAELLERFERVADRPAAQSLTVFQGRERWQVWKRRL
jgi:SAM-dependent methyltransferase